MKMNLETLASNFVTTEERNYPSTVEGACAVKSLMVTGKGAAS